MQKDKTAHSSIRRCFNIDVESDPTFNSPDGCYPFSRYFRINGKIQNLMWSIFRSDVFCPKEGDPREQINGVTAFIDGSSIYGSDDETAIGLRDTVTVAGQTIPAARLKTQKDSEQREALPSRSQCGFDSPQKAGSNPTPDDLTGGDGRAVVQPGLASIHTLFLHEHNRIVDALKQLWDSQASTKDLSAQSREEFIFEVWSPFVFSCPQQLNR